ncbi:MAG TPA: M14 family metallopeptidase [Bryobacteraceae bacterium]|nr:M14 family metallopeptidase [Bryobacteraceae bacterium]
MRHFLRSSLYLGLVLFICTTAHAADFTVGTATAKSGQKASGYIRVPAGSDAATDIAVIVVNGAKPGPVLALLAGAHGTEYASIIALERLAQSADPAALSGTLVIVPLLNVASFLQKVPHINPVDGKGMNRVYPGKADGTQTERALYAITKQVLEKCDYLIDYHGGDLDENLRRYSYWPDTGNPKLDTATRAMVLAFGLDHIIIQHNRPTDPKPAATTITRQAQNMGKPAIAVEAGRAGTTAAEDLDVLIRGTRNVMRQLRMLPGTVTPVEHPLWIGRYTVITSDIDGIFYPLVGPEAYVKQGMTIGYMTDFTGKKLRDIPSPLTGVIIYIGAVPSMKKGDNIGYIGEVVDAP